MRPQIVDFFLKKSIPSPFFLTLPSLRIFDKMFCNALSTMSTNRGKLIQKTTLVILEHSKFFKITLYFTLMLNNKKTNDATISMLTSFLQLKVSSNCSLNNALKTGPIQVLL